MPVTDAQGMESTISIDIQSRLLCESGSRKAGCRLHGNLPPVPGGCSPGLRDTAEGEGLLSVLSEPRSTSFSPEKHSVTRVGGPVFGLGAGRQYTRVTV